MVLRLRFSVAVAGGEGLALASIDGARQPEVTAVNRTSAIHKPRKDGNERCMYKLKVSQANGYSHSGALWKFLFSPKNH